MLSLGYIIPVYSSEFSYRHKKKTQASASDLYQNPGQDSWVSSLPTIRVNPTANEQNSYV